MKQLIISESPAIALVGSALAQASARPLVSGPVILIMLWMIALMIASGLVCGLWNATLPQVFGFRVVTFGQTVRLLVIVAITALFIVVSILLAFGGSIMAFLNKL